MASKTYIETFDHGPRGWFGCIAGAGGLLRLPIIEGAMVSRSPWGVDINHAPPGAGYMHLIFGLPTLPAENRALYQRVEPYADKNRFVEERYPRNFTNARFTVRLRGQVDLKGSHLMLHAQADVGPIRTNWALTGQPLQVTPDWSEQTLHLTPDPAQWTCMGVRSIGADCDFYGHAPIADALRDLNINIILVIGMFDVTPARPIAGDRHILKAGREYPIVRSVLPEGEIWLDTVRIDFAE